MSSVSVSVCEHQNTYRGLAQIWCYYNKAEFYLCFKEAPHPKYIYIYIYIYVYLFIYISVNACIYMQRVK